MHHVYKTKFTCSKEIQFDLEDGIIKNVVFEGGCPGNLLGVGALIEGKPVAEILPRIEGIKCGKRPTSCPDQLSKAIRIALEEEKNA